MKENKELIEEKVAEYTQNKNKTSKDMTEILTINTIGMLSALFFKSLNGPDLIENILFILLTISSIITLSLGAYITHVYNKTISQLKKDLEEIQN